VFKRETTLRYGGTTIGMEILTAQRPYTLNIPESSKKYYIVVKKVVTLGNMSHSHGTCGFFVSKML
jgi:hypothetical protein